MLELSLATTDTAVVVGAVVVALDAHGDVAVVAAPVFGLVVTAVLVVEPTRTVWAVVVTTGEVVGAGDVVTGMAALRTVVAAVVVGTDRPTVVAVAVVAGALVTPPPVLVVGVEDVHPEPVEVAAPPADGSESNVAEAAPAAASPASAAVRRARRTTESR